MKVERPKIVTDGHLDFLDVIRESGVTNMYGAVPYIIEEYPKLKESQAKEILVYWMKSFSERHYH